MKIDILSLFPSMFDGFLSESIIKRALENKTVEINIINFRDYTPLKNGQVDDTIYGGGAGMLIRCEPIFECIDAIKSDESKIVILSPGGEVFKETYVKEFKEFKHLIIICGHYEGFDERIYTLADYQISLGDFVLTGGEIPAMAITDAIVRLLPGVINADSLESEAFENDLLDYPSYTKPQIYRDMEVPEVLVSGDHKKIAEWRQNARIDITRKKRPDLLIKSFNDE